jgi:hypothetical protein
VLVCPVCDGEHTRVREYDADFLGHGPDARLAWFYLSWKTYERHAAERGWPSVEQAFADFGDADPRGASPSEASERDSR